MGIKVKDYILEINRQKQEMFEKNESYLILKAGELHAKCGTKGSPTLIQCCSAMKQCMLEGDQIIYDKANKSGVSVALTIKYNVLDMSKRQSLHTVRKRGRPAGSKNRNKIDVPSNGITNGINLFVENWMRKEKIKYEELDNKYLINDPYGIWIIPKYDNGTASERFLSSITLINEDFYKCSIIFKDTKDAHDFWESMSEEIIERLNLTALFVAKDGSVSQKFY